MVPKSYWRQALCEHTVWDISPSTGRHSHWLAGLVPGRAHGSPGIFLPNL